MPETPLETAQRIWPGEWFGTDDHLTRGLLEQDGDGYLMFVQALNYGDHWRLQLGVRGWNVWNVRGELAHVLAAARDKVQSMARDFARAAGVAVAE